MDNSSFFEFYTGKLISKAKKYIWPLACGLSVGLLCYLFFFTNKLAQQDEIASLFTKGSSLSSGRWGLELISVIFPDYSMSWIYGIISLILLSAGACLIIDLFEINNPYVACIFSALFTSSPSVTGFFCLPFTCTSYSTSLLLAVLAVFLIVRKTGKRKIFAFIPMVLSLGIYQGYVSLAAALLVVYLLRELLICNKAAKIVFRHAILYLGFLAVSVLLYYAITIIINKIFGIELLSYAYSDYGILMRLRVAYTAFAGYFIKGYFSFVNSVPSLIMHILCICVTAYLFIRKCIEIKDKYIIILAAVLLVMLPLAINSMYLVSSVNVMSAIVFMSFNAMYLLMLVLFDGSAPAYPRLRGVLELGLTLIVVSNIYFANRISLKMYLQTEELRSYYTSLMTEVLDSGEYEPGKPLAVIGTPQGTYSLDEIDSSNFIGLTAENIYDIYTRMNYIRYYLGYDFQDVSLGMQYYLSSTDEYKAMPCYPAEGSVAEIEGITVVKLSD